MILYTAHYSIRHPARLDITRAGCDRLRKAGKPCPGEILAPSADLLRWGLDARRRACGTSSGLATAWYNYERAYIHEVNDRARTRMAEIDTLLALPEAVIVCFCGEEYTALGHCHRFPAARILSALGAEYRGEMCVESTPPRQISLFGGVL